jgi:hypothetical protein
MLGAQYPAFDPAAVRTMADALDEAWAILAGNGRGGRSDPQETRLALARCIIGLASAGDYDTATLRDAALARLPMAYTSPPQC